MLSFPAVGGGSHWQHALVSVSKGKGGTSSRLGRVASLIIPRLYLSDYFTARDPAELSKLGITHIISIIETTPQLPDTILASNKLHINLTDRPESNILEYLEISTKFIRSALSENKDNKVLVHCFQGISRSATLVCAYLIATMRITAPESIAFVQARRGIVCPNLGFRHQLETYQKLYPPPPRKSKLGKGIAERIRWLKAIGAPPDSENPLKECSGPGHKTTAVKALHPA